MASFNDVLVDETANTYAQDFVRAKISEIVEDPEVAQLLTPEHIIGCKRLVIDTDYFETFNRSNVDLVDVSSDPIVRINETGLATKSSQYDFDVLIFATGFDAMTGSILKVDISGRDGLRIQDKWAAGPRTYLGLTIPGFPNMFTISGPGSPSVLTNMIISIEQHVEWIMTASSALMIAAPRLLCSGRSGKIAGSITLTRKRIERCFLVVTLGTLAQTCRARLASSCRYWVSRAMFVVVNKSSKMIMKDL